MIIEPLTSDKLPDIAALQKKIYDICIPTEKWTVKSALAFFTYQYQKQSDLFFVARKDQQIIGFVCGYIKPWSNGNHLMCEEFVVDLPYRGTKTALKLMSKLIDTAITKYHITLIEGTTYEDKNGLPWRLYEKIGCTKTEGLFLIEGEPSTISSKFSILLPLHPENSSNLRFFVLIASPFPLHICFYFKTNHPV